MSTSIVQQTNPYYLSCIIISEKEIDQKQTHAAEAELKTLKEKLQIPGKTNLDTRELWGCDAILTNQSRKVFIVKMIVWSEDETTLKIRAYCTGFIARNAIDASKVGTFYLCSGPTERYETLPNYTWKEHTQYNLLESSCWELGLLGRLRVNLETPCDIISSNASNSASQSTSSSDLTSTATSSSVTLTSSIASASSSSKASQPSKTSSTSASAAKLPTIVEDDDDIYSDYVSSSNGTQSQLSGQTSSATSSSGAASQSTSSLAAENNVRKEDGKQEQKKDNYFT